MPLNASVGISQALDSHEAAVKATSQALRQLSQGKPTLALIIAGYEYAMDLIVSGVTSLVGEIPVFGVSTSAGLTASGIQMHTVQVALLAGEKITAAAEWWPEFGKDSGSLAPKICEKFALEQNPDSILLLGTDGLNGDAAELCARLPKGSYQLAGCLAGGDLLSGKTFQIGGAASGSGGVAAALLSGEIVAGIGSKHGWQPVGAFAQVSQAKGAWVRALDGRKAAEYYAEIFGHPARDWAFPPLDHLVRLYPLGLERSETQKTQAQNDLIPRTPLRVEADGSLRMTTAIPQGATAHVMIGSSTGCLDAAKQAAQQALAEIGKARPVLALCFADLSWQIMLESQPGSEIDAIRAILGSEIPLIGGYTFGQIARSSSGTPELLNQHLQITLLAEPQPAKSG